MPPQAHDPEHALYDYLATLRFDDLSAATIRAAQTAIVDHVTCAVVGLRLPWTRAVVHALEAARALEELPPGGGGARVYGAGLAVPPLSAALVNGTAAHGLDLDDTHLPTMSHPGSVVIPAVLAEAERSGAGGRAFLTAVVAGYEAMGRIGAAVGLGYGERGFHPTGQHGPMAAAVAATVLTGGDATEIEAAVGNAASFGGGIKAFSSGPGMVKRLHAGRAAEAGLLAATLVRSGFAGPRSALTGRFGFVPTLSTADAPDHAALAEGLGSAFVVDDIYLKPYAACAALHGAVAAAATLPALVPAEVDRVVVGVPPRVLAQNSNPDPADVMAAQYSAEYCVALALLGRAGDPLRILDAETGADADVRELAARVELAVDDDAAAAYPLAHQARVEVVTLDGRRSESRASVSAQRDGWALATGKLTSATATLLADGARTALVAAVTGLAADDPPSACLDALVDHDDHDDQRDDRKHAAQGGRIDG